MVLGIKNIFGLEGVVHSWDSCLSFLNRSIPFFPRQRVQVKPKEQKLSVVEAPFIEEISGIAITKLLDVKEQITVMIKLKFIRNRATLKVTNGTQERVIFNPIFRILQGKTGSVTTKFDKQYHFESANTVYDQFNRLINMLKKEEEEKGKGNDKYPWLDNSNERKHMTDREILDKYINLDNSSLTRREKKEIKELLYEYKDTFSLRDEIAPCPNIEVEIDVTDKTPFLIRPFHAKEEDKAILHKEMKRLSYLGILKEGFLAYSSPVM